MGFSSHSRVFLFCCLLYFAAAAKYDDYYSSYNDPGYDTADYDQYGGDVYGSDDSYSTPDYADYYSDNDYNNYPPTARRGPGHRGSGQRYNYRSYNKPAVNQYYDKPSMDIYEKSYSKPKKEFVPVVIKKKKTKKKKILTVHHGFYIPGGTQMFGKFKDLHSCQKACEITPTCFGGDFNPWIGKCFLHSNLTACISMRSHKAITHFKKVPCQIVETSRGHIALGVSVTHGIEMKGIDTLQDCIKKCATAGGGIAPDDAMVAITPQLCCNLDYDFATHKCFFHLCITTAITAAEYCPDVPDSALNSIPNPSSISITLCPLAT